MIQKVGSPHAGLLLNDAVEEALCFGWIDSTLRTRDEHSYLLRFSPRTPDGVWSVNNIRSIEDLERRGVMTKAGLEKVRMANCQSALGTCRDEIVFRFRIRGKGRGVGRNCFQTGPTSFGISC